MPRRAAGTTRKSRTSASRPLPRARSKRRVLNDRAARTLTSLQSDNIQDEKAGKDPERNDDSRGVNDSGRDCARPTPVEDAPRSVEPGEDLREVDRLRLQRKRRAPWKDAIVSLVPRAIL